MEENIAVNGKSFRIVKLLGKGKGGYSYLAEDGADKFVVKQIHHEPCEYYNFGDKLAAELNDYNRLSAVGIRIPRLLDADIANERLLKEYIDGPTVAELVSAGRLTPRHIEGVKQMCALLYAAGLNIDYYPTNFIDTEAGLYYIDYECNAYSDEWNFENWGSKYWRITDNQRREEPRF